MVFKYTGADYELIPAESGKKCIELLKNNEIPDLILLDIMMPEMSVWLVFDELKENFAWKNISVVFLTARTDKLAERAGKHLGKDYIEKPVDVEDLKKRIDKILKAEH